MKALIVDDHAVVRRGVRQIILDEFPDTIVIEAGTGKDMLALARAQNFDIAVLDVSLPDRSGVDLLRDLRQIRPHLPIIILSMHPEEQFAVRVLRAGAVGYVTKDSASEELTIALRKGLEGDRYLSRKLAERVALDAIIHDGTESDIFLSDREHQILCLIARGKTVGQIAVELSLSGKTVSTYRSRLLEKLRLSSNYELTQYALRNHLVEA